MVDVAKEAVKQVKHYRKEWPIVVLVLLIVGGGLWYQERTMKKLSNSYSIQMTHLLTMIDDRDKQFTRCQEEMLSTLKEMEIHLKVIADR